MRISHIINGKRPVRAELALLFGKLFSQTPTYWMNLQTNYDLKITEIALMEKVRQVQPLSHAA